MPTEGRRSHKPAARKPSYKPQMTALERYQRGRKIAEMRAHHPKPIAWATIAKHVGLSVSGAKDAYNRFLAAETLLLDGTGVVDETIDVMTVAMHEAFQTYEAADPGGSVRVQALKMAVETAVGRLHIMRAAGRAPRSLAAPSMVAEMQVVFREFAELLRRHDVGDDALREFLGLAETRMGRMTAIEGRAPVTDDEREETAIHARRRTMAQGQARLPISS